MKGKAKYLLYQHKSFRSIEEESKKTFTFDIFL
jgi:hypothetical protein